MRDSRTRTKQPAGGVDHQVSYDRWSRMLEVFSASSARLMSMRQKLSILTYHLYADHLSSVGDSFSPVQGDRFCFSIKSGVAVAMSAGIPISLAHTHYGTNGPDTKIQQWHFLVRTHMHICINPHRNNKHGTLASPHSLLVIIHITKNMFLNNNNFCSYFFRTTHQPHSICRCNRSDNSWSTQIVQ